MSHWDEDEYETDENIMLFVTSWWMVRYLKHDELFTEQESDEQGATFKLFSSTLKKNAINCKNKQVFEKYSTCFPRVNCITYTHGNWVVRIETSPSDPGVYADYHVSYTNPTCQY